jgi:putative protease
MPRPKEAKEAKGAEEVGEVFTFFSKVGVAGIKLTGTLNVGDKIHVKGATTDFEQVVDSMQIDRQPVQTATTGASIGIKVSEVVRPGDKIFKVA